MKVRDQTGFSTFEFIVVVAVLAIVAVAGLRILNSHSNTNASTTSVSSTGSKAANVSSAPAIKTATDLDKAQTTLDQNDPAATNSSDSKQLDSQVNAF